MHNAVVYQRKNVSSPKLRKENGLRDLENKNPSNLKKARKNKDTTIVEMPSDSQPEMTSSCSFSNYVKAILAITSVVGTVALVQKTGFLPSSWRSSDAALDNTLDNPSQLIQGVITFADNSFPMQPGHAKRAFGSEFQINTYTTNSQSLPSVAALSSGDFVVVWVSEGQDGDGTGIYGQRFSSTGVPQGSEFQINTYTVGSQLVPSVASLTTGDFVVVWDGVGATDSSGIYGQHFWSTGNPQDSEFQINTYTTSWQMRSSVAALGTGAFVVVWQSNGQDGDSYGVYGQRFSNTGTPQGSEFQINTYTAETQFDPSVAALSTGDFVVAWSSFGQDGSNQDIYGQRYSSTGVPQGGEFQINTYTTAVQRHPSIAALNSGGFVVVWHSNGQHGDSGGIYGQRYLSTGNPQGSEFQINTYTTAMQRHPSIAALSSGGFVVLWHSNGQYGGSGGIYGQRYLSTGAPQGSEFRISNYNDFLRLDNPSVTGLSTGGFVVVWDDWGGDGWRQSIHGCIYFNDSIPPRLINNTLTINKGETIILSTLDINASDVDNSASELTFAVSNVQYGQFERVSNADVAITSFTQQDIMDGNIQFVHDGSQNPPTYTVSVSDGELSDGPTAASITFYNITPMSTPIATSNTPLLVNNVLTISEGETIILSTTNLNATDIDSNNANLIFTVSNVQNGQFERISNAGMTIISFTQQDVMDNAIQFVHNGSESMPTYDVRVSDGSLTDGPSSANIAFTNMNDAPVLVNNALTITEGETVITDNMLLIKDIDNTPNEIFIKVIKVSSGKFINGNAAQITEFTQQEIDYGEIKFVTIGPTSFNITFSNQAHVFLGPVIPANITFVAVNKTPDVAVNKPSETPDLCETFDAKCRFAVLGALGGLAAILALPVAIVARISCKNKDAATRKKNPDDALARRARRFLKKEEGTSLEIKGWDNFNSNYGAAYASFITNEIKPYIAKQLKNKTFADLLISQDRAMQGFAFNRLREEHWKFLTEKVGASILCVANESSSVQQKTSCGSRVTVQIGDLVREQRAIKLHLKRALENDSYIIEIPKNSASRPSNPQNVVYIPPTSSSSLHSTSPPKEKTNRDKGKKIVFSSNSGENDYSKILRINFSQWKDYSFDWEINKKTINSNLKLNGLHRGKSTTKRNNCLLHSYFQNIQNYLASNYPALANQLEDFETFADAIRQEINKTKKEMLRANEEEEGILILQAIQNYLTSKLNRSFGFELTILVTDREGDIAMVDNIDDFHALIAPGDITIPLRIIHVNTNHYEPLFKLHQAKDEMGMGKEVSEKTSGSSFDPLKPQYSLHSASSSADDARHAEEKTNSDQGKKILSSSNSGKLPATKKQITSSDKGLMDNTKTVANLSAQGLFKPKKAVSKEKSHQPTPAEKRDNTATSHHPMTH